MVKVRLLPIVPVVGVESRYRAKFEQNGLKFSQFTFQNVMPIPETMLTDVGLGGKARPSLPIPVHYRNITPTHSSQLQSRDVCRRTLALIYLEEDRSPLKQGLRLRPACWVYLTPYGGKHMGRPRDTNRFAR